MSTQYAESMTNSKANSSIFDEKSGLCSCEREDRTNGSSTKRATNLPDLSQKDAEFAKIGIVVPIYNVAPYLRECLDSVLNQTYKNFHAVLVNDGSTDNSKEIALDYVAKDSRFTLIDKENGGLSSARNAGIAWFNSEIESSLRGVANAEAIHKNKKIDCHDFATQNLAMTIYADNLTLYHNAKSTSNPPQIDYIIFLDSDDFWEHNLLETCVRVAESSHICHSTTYCHSERSEESKKKNNRDSSVVTLPQNDNNSTESKLDSANSQNLDIIWFNYQAFYDNNNRGGG